MENYFDVTLPADDLRAISSIGLAHLGDAVFELLVRTWLCAQVHSVPTHASRAQYAQATALEALLGWLYLQGRRERINELFCRMMEE